MPTGYTAGVANGTVTDLRTFALHCARGMGALVTMRDMPFDAPIPDRFEPRDYHRKAYEGAKSELDRVMGLTDERCIDEATKEYDAEIAELEKSRSDNLARRERYENMISVVERWEGSPDGIKAFMLSQLRESLKFDCTEYERPAPKLMTGSQWRYSRLAELEESIAHHATEHEKEVERVELRNAWVAQLMASLPPEEQNNIKHTKDNEG